MSNLYEILGVKNTATPDEIRKAYRKLSLRYHPDRNPDNPESLQIFQTINLAYDTLSDPNMRAQYDYEQLQSTSYTQRAHKSNAASEAPMVDPEIILFYCSTTTIYSDEAIDFYWRTRGADVVYLYPFGQVSLTGHKKLRIKNFNSSEIRVDLVAYNTVSKKKTAQYFRIKNIKYLPLNVQREIKIKRTKKHLKKYAQGYITLGLFLLFSIPLFFATRARIHMENIANAKKMYIEQNPEMYPKITFKIFDSEHSFQVNINHVEAFVNELNDSANMIKQKGVNQSEIEIANQILDCANRLELKHLTYPGLDTTTL